MTEHLVMMTLNKEYDESFRNILWWEYNMPYGSCPEEMYEDETIKKFVMEMYYGEYFENVENQKVWKLIRETRSRFYEEFDMENAYGPEISKVNSQTDEAMIKLFSEKLKQLNANDSEYGIYLNALMIMECQ